MKVHTLGNNAKEELPLLYPSPRASWHHCMRGCQVTLTSGGTQWVKKLFLFEHVSFGLFGSSLGARTPLPRALWKAETVLGKEATGHIWCRKTSAGCGGGGGNNKRRKKEGQRRWKTKGRHYQGLGTWSLVSELLST